LRIGALKLPSLKVKLSFARRFREGGLNWLLEGGSDDFPTAVGAPSKCQGGWKGGAEAGSYGAGNGCVYPGIGSHRYRHRWQ